jgi:twinkle protein
MPLDLVAGGETTGLTLRKITTDTCELFNYRTILDYNGTGQRVQVAPYYDADGNLVAQKIRFKDKTFKVLGSLDTALPFGARAWQRSGRQITITEGEIDALSMSQVQGNKYPVVSIACGAGAQITKYITKHREYLRGFEKVVIMFDNDEPGRAAADAAAKIIGSKAHIATLPQGFKDANDMLVAGKTKELIDAMWRAEQYRPEGIVNMASLKDRFMAPPVPGLSWPFDALTKLTYGIRLQEIYALGAGTGVGKTDFFTQTMEHLVNTHGVPIGVFSLEQPVVETATRLAGKVGHKTFHIPDAGWTDDDKLAAWDKLQTGGKVHLYDSFGVNEWDVVREKMEYLYHVEGVQYFFLDHLTALAAAEDNEREGLERIMADMGSFVKQLPITIFFISHLATPEGKPHEEGGRVMIRHFKGSRSIGFWSVFMFGMERNQQADNEAERQTTTFRVLKDRFTGRATGEVFYLGYNRETGMLYETTAPETRSAQAHGFKEESPAGGPSDF